LLIYNGKCVSSCPDGTHPNSAGTACTSEVVLLLPMIYFPHLIASVLLVIVCIIAYFKDKGSLIISNILIMLGPIEFIAYIVQSAYAILYSANKYAGMSLAAVAFYIVLNVSFSITFDRQIASKDEEFIIWK